MAAPRGLREAGVEVVHGVLEAEAQNLIKAWSKFITTGQSYLTLKLAISLDGRIATRTGASKWITGPESRLRVQTLRAQNDAVMVGVNTVLSDNPRLTVRDVPGRSPVRVIVDSKLRIPTTSQVVQTASQTPTCVVTTIAAPKPLEEALQAFGVRVIRVPPTAEGRCEPIVMLRELAAREVVSVMCEGGSELGGSLLASGLADELHVFVAPLLLGPRGRPGAVDWAGPENPSDAPRIDPPHWELCGGDAYVWGAAQVSQENRAHEPRLANALRRRRAPCDGCGNCRSRGPVLRLLGDGTASDPALPRRAAARGRQAGRGNHAEILELVENMAETMYDAPGCGLRRIKSAWGCAFS